MKIPGPVAAVASGTGQGLHEPQPATTAHPPNANSYANAVTSRNDTATTGHIPNATGENQIGVDHQRQYEQDVRRAAQEIMRKKADKERREKNIVIKGVHETDADGDKDVILQILDYLGCHKRAREIVNIERLGIRNGRGRKRRRLILVTFRTASAAYEVITKAPKLDFSSLLGSLYIQNDLSKEERIANYIKRQRNGGGDAPVGGGQQGRGGAQPHASDPGSQRPQGIPTRSNQGDNSTNAYISNSNRHALNQQYHGSRLNQTESRDQLPNSNSGQEQELSNARLEGAVAAAAPAVATNGGTANRQGEEAANGGQLSGQGNASGLSVANVVTSVSTSNINNSSGNEGGAVEVGGD